MSRPLLDVSIDGMDLILIVFALCATAWGISKQVWPTPPVCEACQEVSDER